MPQITFSDTDDTVEVAVGASLHEACEANDAPIPFMCTAGSCGTCIIAMEEGADNVNPVEADERQTILMTTDVDGARLACQLVVNGDITIRALD